MRIEKDALGEMPLPDGAYYGIQAFRSLSNFDVTDKTFNDYPAVVRALAEIKKACALANRDIGALGADKAGAIARACDDILEGRMEGAVSVNIWRGGGTSINMNLNEVIANRANELLTGHKGIRAGPSQYATSTCASPPTTSTPRRRTSFCTARRAARWKAWPRSNSFARKSKEFGGVVRLGRTCLQDGVPMTLGQVFAGFHGVIRRSRERLEALREGFPRRRARRYGHRNGLGVLPGYVEAVYPHLSAIVGFEMRLPDTPEGAPSPMRGCSTPCRMPTAFSHCQAHSKVLACSAGKIANDFRLLSSGPRSGFGEIRLPAVAPVLPSCPARSIPSCATLSSRSCIRWRQTTGRSL